MELRFLIGTRYILFAIFGVIFTTSSFLIYIYHPANLIATQLKKFSPNSSLFLMWEAPPFEVFVKVYLFNVTNPNEFLRGEEKLRFQEVGPYSYREVLYNINSTFNDNGTVSFIPKRRLEFSLNNSVGDACADRFTLPNIALLGLTAYLHDSSMFTNLAFSSITSYLAAEAFVNLTVQEYLLGYDDPLIKLANNFIPNWIDFEKLGILDRVMAIDNSSEWVTMNIQPEMAQSLITNEKNVLQYAVERWAHSPGLPLWGYKDSSTQNSVCNTVEGTFMGTLFPPSSALNNTFRLFRRSFCRPISFHFHENRLGEDGYNLNIYKVDSNFLSRAENNSDNTCYCRKNNPDKCLPNGVGDVSPCYYGIPVAISQPHFLNTDASVSENYEGLTPQPDKHEMLLGIHPEMGVAMEFHMRAQINLAVPDTKYNTKVKPFNNFVIPLLWVDLTIERLPSVVNFYVLFICHILPIGEEVLMYALGILGFLLICYTSIIAVLVITKQSNHSQFNFKYTPVQLVLLKEKQTKCDTYT